MNSVVLWKCFQLLLIAAACLNANTIQVIPEDRQIIHTNGTTHLIPQFYVMPKNYHFTGHKSQPAMTKFNSERSIETQVNINNTLHNKRRVKNEEEVAAKTYIFYKSTKNDENTQTDLDRYAQTNRGVKYYIVNNNQESNPNSGKIHRMKYIIKRSREEGAGRTSIANEMKENKNPKTIAETSHIYRFSNVDGKKIKVVDDAGKTKVIEKPNYESNSSDDEDHSSEIKDNTSENVKDSYDMANESDFSKATKEIIIKSSNVGNRSEIRDSNNEFIKVIPLYNGNKKQENESDNVPALDKDWKRNDLYISEAYTEHEPDDYAEVTSSTTETRVQTAGIKIDNIHYHKVGQLPKEENLDNDINTYHSEEQYENQTQNKTEDGTPAPVVLITNLVEKIKELKPIRYADLHSEITKNKSLEVKTTRYYNSEIGKLVEGGRIKNQSHIITLISQICAAANQNLKDFWKILSKYLGLRESDESVNMRDGDLLKIEKLYEILTIFTQLRMTSDMGYPIDHIIDDIVEKIPGNLTFSVNTTGNTKKLKCPHCVNNLNNHILYIFQNSNNIKSDDSSHVHLKQLPIDLSSKQEKPIPEADENNILKISIAADSRKNRTADIIPDLIRENNSIVLLKPHFQRKTPGQTTNSDFFEVASSEIENTNDNGLVTESIMHKKDLVTDQENMLMNLRSYTVDNIISPIDNKENNFDTEHIEQSKKNSFIGKSNFIEESHIIMDFDSTPEVRESTLSEKANETEILSETFKPQKISYIKVLIPVNTINSKNELKEEYPKFFPAIRNDSITSDINILGINITPIPTINTVSEDISTSNEFGAKRITQSYDNLQRMIYSPNKSRPAFSQKTKFKTNPVPDNLEVPFNAENITDFVVNHTDNAVTMSHDKYKNVDDLYPYIINTLLPINITDFNPTQRAEENTEHLKFKKEKQQYAIKDEPNRDLNQDISDTQKVISLPKTEEISKIDVITLTNPGYDSIKKIPGETETLTSTEENPYEIHPQSLTVDELWLAHYSKDDISNKQGTEINISEDTSTEKSSEIEMTTPINFIYNHIKINPNVVEMSPYEEKNLNNDNDQRTTISDPLPKHDSKDISDITEIKLKIFADTSVPRTEKRYEIEVTTPINHVYVSRKNNHRVPESPTYTNNDNLQIPFIGEPWPDHDSQEDINNNRGTEMYIPKNTSTEKSFEIELTTSTNLLYNQIKEIPSVVELPAYPDNDNLQIPVFKEPWPDNYLKDHISNMREVEMNTGEDISLPRTNESSEIEVTIATSNPYYPLKEIPSVVETTYPDNKNVQIPVFDEPPAFRLNISEDISPPKIVERSKVDMTTTTNPHHDSIRGITSVVKVTYPEEYPDNDNHITIAEESWLDYDLKTDTNDEGKIEMNILEDSSIPRTEEGSKIETMTSANLLRVPMKFYANENEDEYEIHPTGSMTTEKRPTQKHIDIAKNNINIHSANELQIDLDYLEKQQHLNPIMHLRLSAEEIPKNKTTLVLKNKDPIIQKALTHQIALPYEIQPKNPVYGDPEIKKKVGGISKSVNTEEELNPELLKANTGPKNKLPGSKEGITKEEINIPEGFKVSNKELLVPSIWRSPPANVKTYLEERYPWLIIDQKPANPLLTDFEKYKNDDVIYRILHGPYEKNTIKTKAKDLDDLITLIKNKELKMQDYLHLANGDPNNRYSYYKTNYLLKPENYVTQSNEKIPDNYRQPGAFSFGGQPILNNQRGNEFLTPKSETKSEKSEHYLNRLNVLADPIHINKGAEDQTFSDSSINLWLASYDILVNPYVKTLTNSTTDLVQKLKQLNYQKNKFEIFKTEFQAVIKNRVKKIFVRIFLEVVPYLRERQVSDNVIFDVVSECEKILLPDLRDGFTSQCQMESYERSVEKVEELVDSLLRK